MVCMYEICTVHSGNIRAELPGYKAINYCNMIHIALLMYL